jgi:hypothetical protein
MSSHSHSHDHGHGGHSHLHAGDPMCSAQYHAMVAHRHSFDQQTMRMTFEGAGLEKFKYGKSIDFTWDGKDLEVFLATAVKK